MTGDRNKSFCAPPHTWIYSEHCFYQKTVKNISNNQSMNGWINITYPHIELFTLERMKYWLILQMDKPGKCYPKWNKPQIRDRFTCVEYLHLVNPQRQNVNVWSSRGWVRGLKTNTTGYMLLVRERPHGRRGEKPGRKTVLPTFTQDFWLSELWENNIFCGSLSYL